MSARAGCGLAAPVSPIQQTQTHKAQTPQQQGTPGISPWTPCPGRAVSGALLARSRRVPAPPFSPWCAAARPASPGARRRLGARVDQLPHDLARGGRKAQRRRDPGAKLNHVGHKTILSLAKVRKSAGVALTAGFGPPDVKRSARRAHCRGRPSAPPRRATFSEMNFATPLPALTLARSRGQASLARRFGAQAAPAANISTCGCRSRSPSVPSGRNPCARKACNSRPRPGRGPPDGSSSRPSLSNSASVRCPRRAGGEFASTMCRMTSPTAGGK